MLLGNLTPEMLIANLIALGIGMTVHEFAHNYVAWRMGDNEPARQGRLTLNPLVHINWIGWLMFAVIGFGILGSAPISPYRMPLENRRWRWFAAVAAGPVSNLILATLFAVIFHLLGGMTMYMNNYNNILVTILMQAITLNVLLFVFNLLPLFPVDGWQLVLSLLSPDLAATWQRHQQNSYYVFIGLIILSFLSSRTGLPNILGILISEPTSAITQLLLGI